MLLSHARMFSKRFFFSFSRKTYGRFIMFSVVRVAIFSPLSGLRALRSFPFDDLSTATQSTSTGNVHICTMRKD